MSSTEINTTGNRFKQMMLEIALNNGFNSFEEYIAYKYNKTLDKAILFKESITNNKININIEVG